MKMTWIEQIASFLQMDFFVKALITSLISSLIAPALGLFLILRRMSLLGDALSHALLPGVAIAYYFFGNNALGLAIGGLAAGLLISFFSVWVHKNTNLQEDSSFAAFYLLSIALGVFLISLKGSQSDLLHILFGSPLLISDDTFYIHIFLNLFALIFFILFFKHLLMEVFNSTFYQSLRGNPSFIQGIFLTLVVISLVGNFQSNGTLLTMGQLLLPAIISRLLFEKIKWMIFSSIIISAIGSIIGLLISMQWDLPSGPSTLMIWGCFYFITLLLNPKQGILFKWIKLKHFKA